MNRGDRLLDVLAGAKEENRTLAQGLEAVKRQRCEEETELVRLQEGLANAEFASAMLDERCLGLEAELADV
jgi:hypothetical protein